MAPQSSVTGSVRRHLWVSGRVQGVWFRGGCAEQARSLGVAGWARNLGDGRVEVVAEGRPVAIAALEQWCHSGPAAAVVTAVQAIDEPVEGLTGFSVRR